MRSSIVKSAVLASLVVLSACNNQVTSGVLITPTATTPAASVDPKSATAYIKVSTPDELRNVFLALSQDGEVSSQFRQFLMSYAMRQASGSGFVAAGQAGHGALVVTNRHVVDGVDRPQLSFDGGTTTISAKILYVDRDYDLAILELSNPMPGLAISGDYREMQEVFALGYPGTSGGGAHYQASQGTVSNKCIEDDAITNSGSKNCWIQHTAAIDPGSSGGPLVNRENQVVGVNAAFIESRHDMFLAVPASAIKLAIDKAEGIRTNRTNEAWMKEQLKFTCYQFVSELSSGKASAARVLPFLSNKIVTKKGLLTFAKFDEDPDIVRIFVGSPFTGMQISIALQLRMMFDVTKGALNSERCENINPMDKLFGNDDVRINVSLKNSTSVELSWIFERGSWRLSDFGS